MLRIHIIAPYSAMVSVLNDCIPLFPNYEITYSVGDLQKGADIAIAKEQEGIDLFISRGGTAKLIKGVVSVPVIDIHLSGYDLTRSLTLASRINEKTAVVGFQNITTGASAIIQLLHLPINVYTIHSADEVAGLLINLKNKGYDHILGDVITINTSHKLGLKGMLLQSGKESVIRAIEEAIYLLNTLSKRSNVEMIIKKLFLDEYRNIMIFDEENSLIYKHLKDFKEPLKDSEWGLLHTSLSVQPTVEKHYVKNSDGIQVKGKIIDKTFKIYTLNKHTVTFDGQGLRIIKDVAKEPVASSSKQLSNRLNVLKTLFDQKEPILLTGDKGTGKYFLATQLHFDHSSNGLLIEVDANKFDYTNMNQLITLNPSTILLVNFNRDTNMKLLKKCIQICNEHGINFIAISNVFWEESDLHNIKLNHVHLPSLSDRKEDIVDLVNYFLADFHQKFGTKPVAISKEALHYLQDLYYDHNIHSLKQLLQKATLDEKDYVLQKETILAVTNENKLAINFPISGTLKEIEKAIIEQVLKEEKDNQTQAAKRLGINRATLWRKLKE
ncbi:sigma-54-dependent Fis family transcriptional regulator [Sutcliffiella rhizosphaerae]|uniref:Anaerobic nitric oxide reductase transcription regulator NorR n=1 Tax=Sutcliffiella rhizosphaerae TaxID=2880967 RepID=A0ABN8ABB3_9BACI|nr:sigma-54-dependent transcriptional regulator [Sutcliffiella rhizosphaerae]CAG9621461.1 Anaerobic nitric oxide reductase transcription regulator NorR [Sutcliffiella rhizosphaerae]